MRVLLISHSCQSRTEGQPKAQRLSRYSDVELRVLVPNRWWQYTEWRFTDPPLEGPYEYTVGKIAMAWSGPAQWYLHTYPKLSSVIREFRPDVIDLWEEPWGLVSVHACRLRNRYFPRAKIISETEQNINKMLPFPFERMRNYTLKNCDYAIGRSSEAVSVLRAKGYRGPAKVVPNGSDTDLFHPMDRALCRKDLGVEGFVVGYAGRFVEEKGLSDLVQAIRDCPADVRLLLVGSGPYEGHIRAQVAGLGISQRVRFIPPRPLEELPRIMNAMDVFALPSRTLQRWKEQFGRVIIEAHACRTPVIGSSSGAIPEVIGAGGLVFPEGNVTELTRSIQQLRADAALRAHFGQVGYRQVQERYTWDRVAEQMHNAYLEVMATDPSESHVGGRTALSMT